MQKVSLAQRLTGVVGKRRFLVAAVAEQLKVSERDVRSAIDAIRRLGGAVKHVGHSEFQIVRVGPKASAAAKGGK